jgi:deoxyribodipyrimidine photo-lyase
MNIFIHRRDLRINDNTTINLLSKKHGDITPIFIFTPEQIDQKKNEYFSNNLVQFMCESLTSLNSEYNKKKSRLNLFEGDIIDVLDEIKKTNNINSVGFNADYSPYSKKRDNNIKNWCDKNNVSFFMKEDMLLVNVLNNKNYPNEKPYEIFTHFANYQKKNYVVKKPSRNRPKFNDIKINNKYSIDIKNINKFYKENKSIMCHGGRDNGEKKLADLRKQTKYAELRNNLDYETTRLSPYINLGIVSIREVYHKSVNLFGEDSALVNELWWRDFFYNILHHNPYVVGNAMNEKFKNVKWDNNELLFKKWKEGKTGFPIVDACMNELNTTGFLHNRGRMVVASFLTKHLFTDWKWGEKYFAQQLIDCNVSANNGGWQWTASTGVDSHRTFYRVFNPWLQIAKFDEDCIYTKKWLPVLANIPNEHIKKWDKYYKQYQGKIDYPSPVVDHPTRRDYALKKLKSY